MKHLKITILGCSVALRVRPPEKYPNNKNYGQFLNEFLQEKYTDTCFQINNKAFTRATLKDIHPKIDELISDFPDYFILNIGIPDASTREIPRFLSNYITYKGHLTISKIITAIHSFLIKPFIKTFVIIRGKKTWVNTKEFKILYTKLIKYLKKETNARIILIPINPPSERIERKLPGTSKNVEKYNKIIKNISNEFENVDVVNINDLSQQTDFPDGIHYSAEGHKKIAEKIAELINID